MAGDRGSGPDRGWQPPPLTPDAAESLPGFERLSEIGRGGDSVVYRARQSGLGRDVAIKVLQVDDPDRVARFEREVQITVALGRQHPNIVNVLAVGTTESGKPALVMDFFEGGTLHDRLRAHGPLPPEEVVRIGVVLADALAFAHAKGVLHRDIKPQNVLVLPTSWVLADFGISRLSDAEHTASAETFTYRHASPQILDGHPPTQADDLWSLGSTLYTLLDGRPPFASDDPDDDSALAYLRRARTEPHRSPAAGGAGGGLGLPEVADVIDACLVKDPGQRLASAAALREALSRLRSHSWEPAGDTPADFPAPAAPAAAAPDAREPTLPRSTYAAPSEDARWAPAAVGAEPAAAPAAEPRPVEEYDDEGPPEGPPPVALSVLAHDRAADSGRLDAEPTGRVPDAGQPWNPAAVEAPTRTDDEPAGGRSRRVILALAGTAILVGAVLGIGGALLRGGGEDDAPGDAASTPADGGVTTLLSPPTRTGDVQPHTRPDPALGGQIVDLQVGVSTVELAWTAPGKGDPVGYTVMQNVGDASKPLTELGPSTTEATLPLATVPGTRVCFQVLVFHRDGQVGTSPERCGRAR